MYTRRRRDIILENTQFYYIIHLISSKYPYINLLQMDGFITTEALSIKGSVQISTKACKSEKTNRHEITLVLIWVSVGVLKHSFLDQRLGVE